MNATSALCRNLCKVRGASPASLLASRRISGRQASRRPAHQSLQGVQAPKDPPHNHGFSSDQPVGFSQEGRMAGMVSTDEQGRAKQRKEEGSGNVLGSMAFRQRFLTALLAASSITLALGLAYAFHLERPYWAGVAAMVLSQSAQGESLQKGVWRVVGTVAGALAGMAVLASFGESLFSLLMAYWFLLSLLGSAMKGSRYSYFYYSTALMAVLVASQSHSEAPFSIASARMQENFMGIAAYTLCALCLRPRAATKEIGGLKDFGRDLLHDTLSPMEREELREKVQAGAHTALALVLLDAVWQTFSPPGTESPLFIEIGALFVLLACMVGRFASWQLLLAFAAGILVALILYAEILPRLAGFPELGLVMFFLAFTMAWILPRPEQGMARMGTLLPVFVLSGAGGEILSPEGFLAAATGLLCAALGVGFVFYVLSSPPGRF